METDNNNEEELMLFDNCEVVNSLYNRSTEVIAKNLHLYSTTLEQLPIPTITDIYEKAVNLNLVDNLQRQLSNLPLLEKVLQNSGNWNVIHKSLKLILKKEPDFGYFIASQKVAGFSEIKQLVNSVKSKHGNILQYIHEAIRLGSFFTECGMYECAQMIYKCVDVVDLNGNIDAKFLATSFEISLRLAHVSTLDCKFNEANKAIINASVLLTYLQNANMKCNCSLFYTTCSMYMFSLSQYDKAYNLALQAVQELDCRLTPKVIVDTLRQACKACIIKRYFSQARIYIKEAVMLARYWFGTSHPKYADCLSDYGFYLLSVDSVSTSVGYYQAALGIRQDLFGEESILTAITHEDLAYAIYVRDYSQGDFIEAKKKELHKTLTSNIRCHAEIALNTLIKLLPIDHLMLSSSKRVQALILEEVAIDTNNEEIETQLLESAEKLHLDSLRLARQTFGENNVQTAKHYGNLGRLYQSMKRFKDAERNHLRAIEIKEQLLGKEDYEVALSIGHLASLYNYDMKKYEEAEQLYQRSIAIGRKLFGVWYSGLEYDYRGLIHLYAEIRDFEKMSDFQLQLADWKDERNNSSTRSSRDHELDLLTNDVIVSVQTVLQRLKQAVEITKPQNKVGNGS